MQNGESQPTFRKAIHHADSLFELLSGPKSGGDILVQDVG